MSEIVVITPERLRDIVSDATAEGFHKAQSGNNEPTYYTTKQLAEKFPYSERTLRRWIGGGQLGRITRKGKHLATYQEVEEFLFVRKK